MANLIRIFRAGRHTDANGNTVEFTNKDIDDIVRSYNPSFHEAPIVIGHPKHNAPAFGWTRGLHKRDGEVLASVDQLDPSFAEAVRKGHYKKVSASFYRPDSPNNPTPGKYHLRHIGFLGAQPPAIKGLGDVQFAESDTLESGCLTFEFAEVDLKGDAAATAVETADKVVSEASSAISKAVQETVSKLLSKALKAAFPELDDTKLTEAITTGLAAPPDGEEKGSALQSAIAAALTGAVEAPVKDAVSSAAADAAAQAAPPATADHAEKTINLKERALRRREEELAAAERRHRASAHVSFLEGLAKEGKRLPFQRGQALELLEQLGSGALSFAEGEPSALERVKALMTALPKLVEFNEISGDATSFAEDDPSAIAARATSYQAEQATKGVVVTTAEAVRHVTHR